jgi:membrane protease YdiL (CAAX protease family)
MPMVTALLLLYLERGWAGVIAILRRTYDVGLIRPRMWFLPILLLFPSFGAINYLIARRSGVVVPAPTITLASALEYGTVFLMTYGEELGLTGYALDPLQERHTALSSAVMLGLAWAGYHIPGFLISGYYSLDWIAWHALYTVASRVLFVWIYNNSGRSLFSMALCHWSFGLFWSLWPQDNLQKAVPFYRPQIAATAALLCAVFVVYAWGPRSLARWRFARGGVPASDA